MSVFGMCVVVICWSSLNGEEFYGNLEFYEDQQDHQDFVNQGKYSMGLPWYLKHRILHVSNLINYKDILVVDDLTPWLLRVLLHMGRNASVLTLYMLYTLITQPWINWYNTIIINRT